MSIIDISNLPPGKTLADYMKDMSELSIMPVPSDSFSRELELFDKADYEAKWSRAFRKITLLRVMGRITDKEVGRLVSLIESEDSENWLVCEECIKQKYSEL